MEAKSTSTYTWQPSFMENGTTALVRISLKKISEIVPDSGKIISLREKRGRQANFGNASFP